MRHDLAVTVALDAVAGSFYYDLACLHIREKLLVGNLRSAEECNHGTDDVLPAERIVREHDIEKTVIDRCVHQIYQAYFQDPRPEKMPLLEDLYKALLEQEEKEAHHVATALEIYVKGSLNLFNHRTNVDIDNRFVCYDIRELGKQLKKIGMLVVQDQVWGRVTANRYGGKTTRFYCDEFHRVATRCRI